MRLLVFLHAFMLAPSLVNSQQHKGNGHAFNVKQLFLGNRVATQQKQVGHIKLMWVASVARTTFP